MTIKIKTYERPEWRILQKDFPSKAAMNRRMEELLADELKVED